MLSKNILLGGIALGALVMAGSASAYTLVASDTVTGANTGIETSGFKFAKEKTVSAASPLQGQVEFNLTPSSAAILPSGNTLLTLSLSTGTFGTQVTAANIITNGGCNPTRSVVSGGGTGDSSVQFLLSSLSGCNNSAPIYAYLPFKLTSNASDLSINSTFTTEASTSIDGGSNSLAALQFVQAITTTVTPAASAPQADVTTTPAPYLNLVGGGAQSIGKVLVSVNTAINKTLPSGGTAATQVATSDVTKVTQKVNATSGSFNGLTVTVAGVTGSANGSNTVWTFVTGTAPTAALSVSDYTGGTGANVKVQQTSPASQIQGATTSTDVALTLSSGFTSLADVTGSALSSITLGGTNFVAPWLQGSGNANGTTSVLRITNNSTSATGPVTLQLKSQIPAPTPAASQPSCTYTTLPKLQSILGNGELAISSADLTTCFGAFTRGDVVVTIQAQPSALVAKARIASPNGTVVEQSLGGLQVQQAGGTNVGGITY